MPGASESCCVVDRLSQRNGTGVPAAFMVTILRSVNHGVSLTPGTIASWLASCVAAFQTSLPAISAPVVGSISSLISDPDQPGLKPTL